MIIYNYDQDTKELISENEAKITIDPPIIEAGEEISPAKERVIVPLFATTIKPPDFKKGLVPVFNGVEWRLQEDHRGEVVYDTLTQQELEVDYLGEIKESHTQKIPSSQWDEWDSVNKEWRQKVLEGDDLQQFLQEKYAEIDNETESAIFAGFTFDGKIFSMSLSAQSNWLYLLTQYQAGVYPDKGWAIATKDDSDYILTKDKAIGFFEAAATMKETVLSEGRKKKAELKKKYEV